MTIHPHEMAGRRVFDRPRREKKTGTGRPCENIQIFNDPQRRDVSLEPLA